jgi:hypothetical protein
MLIRIASELSSVVHQLKELDSTSTKIASATGCRDIQQSIAISSNVIYDVIEKVAADYSTANTLPGRMSETVRKMASVLNKPRPTNDTLLKIAAIVDVDDTLTKLITSDITKEAKDKALEYQAYGRELFTHYLGNII